MVPRSGRSHMAIETLEPREFLSATMSAATRWPAAPFSAKQLAGTIYTNQNGDATLKNLKLPARAFKPLGIFWDDPGSLDAALTGTPNADLAFYARDGQPVQIARDGQLTAPVPNNKGMFYLGVQSTTRSATSTYGLQIDGPPVWLDNIVIDRKTWAGANGSDISDDGDSDVYAVKIPRTANWVFEAIPDKAKSPADVTFNVFDSKGRSIAGSFTKPIDAGGAGKTERWTGVGLRKGHTYYFRVDGKDHARGGYGVAVYIADLPHLSVATKTPLIAESNTRGAAVVFSRSDNGLAMTVNYRVRGIAGNGTDYAMLTGSAIIRANALSTKIVIQPILDTLREGDETVIVEVLPSAHYNPALVYSTKVIIRDARAA